MTNNRHDRTRARSLFAAGNPFDGYDAYEYDDGFDDEPPRGPFPLDARRSASLAAALGAGLRERGCDNTLHIAEAWARRERVPWAPLHTALEDRAGFCDCEVLLNVLPPPEE